MSSELLDPAPLADLWTIEPMDLTPCDAPFTDAAWVFELLPRGHRMLALAAGESSRLRSRHGADTTTRFAEITHALRAPSLGGAVFDGEVCAFDAAGRLDRERLHRRSVQREPHTGNAPLVYSIHDLLMHRGHDLRAKTWSQRRERLTSLLALVKDPALRLQRALPVQGEWLHRQAGVLGMAGIAAMRRDAPYRGGPSADWRWIATSPVRKGNP